MRAPREGHRGRYEATIVKRRRGEYRVRFHADSVEAWVPASARVEALCDSDGHASADEVSTGATSEDEYCDSSDDEPPRSLDEAREDDAAPPVSASAGVSPASPPLPQWMTDDCARMELHIHGRAVRYMDIVRSNRRLMKWILALHDKTDDQLRFEEYARRTNVA